MPRTTRPESFGTEYCAGFVDVHGQWNNGFYCPKWDDDPDVPYCCGDEHRRYCCTVSPHPNLHHQQQQRQPPHYRHHQLPDQSTDGRSTDSPPSQGTERVTGPIHYHILLVGFVVGTLILMTSAAVIMCYYCRCCLVYRHRKRSHNRASRHLANGRGIATDIGYPLCVGRTFHRHHAAEMIALRPPSYHTIDDPPPYPDDDADECSPADKRRRPTSDDVSATAATTNRAAGVERRLANGNELLRLRGDDDDDDDSDHRVIRQAVRRYRDAVGRRHLRDRRAVSPAAGQTDSSPRTTCRLDATSTGNDDGRQSWRRYDHCRRPTVDPLPAADAVSPFSPGRAIAQADDGSPPPPTDRSVGVPYSVTCPSRFDGGPTRPDAGSIPRPSSSGDPVASGTAGDRTWRPGSRQTSSVFEISSYIIAGSSAYDSSVQPSVDVEL